MPYASFRLRSSNVMSKIEFGGMSTLRVADFRTKVAEKLSLPEEEIELYQGTIRLRDDATVQQYSTVEVEKNSGAQRKVSATARRDAKDKANNVKHIITSEQNVLAVGGKYNNYYTTVNQTDQPASGGRDGDEEDNPELARIKEIQQRAEEGLSDVRMERRRAPIRMDSKGPPPPGYICHNCGKGGHYIHDCPDPKKKMATVAAPTGIPESLLVECSADDPARCVTRDGRFVKRIVANGYIPLGDGVDEANRAPMPEDWKCAVCHQLLDKAVSLDCCKTRACSSCVEKYISDNGAECFGCDDYICLDDVEPLTQLREDIIQYKKSGVVPPQPAGQKRPREE
jgi:hypothetical protein